MNVNIFLMQNAFNILVIYKILIGLSLIVISTFEKMHLTNLHKVP